MTTRFPLAILLALALALAVPATPGLAAGWLFPAAYLPGETGDEQLLRAFRHAAETGDAAAIARLKPRVPRFDDAGTDRWLDAAMDALYLPDPLADAVLPQLLVSGMAWSTPGPLRSLTSVDDTREPVLVHAVRAGRADWVGRLLALGAPLTEGGTRELAFAVEQGNPATVKLLLDLGADPLAWEQGALQRILYADYAKDPETGHGGLTPQAAVLLPLLVEHIVTFQKIPLAQVTPSPLEQAIIKAGGADGTARVRMLLDAGFPADSVSEKVAIDALMSQDRTLAETLLAHGMLRVAPGQPRPRHENLLLAAVIYRRADLLPRLFRLGYDPNQRLPGRYTPVALAIRNGAIDELDALLAAGGRIDPARDAQGNSMLELAVTSGNAAVLARVGNSLALRLDRVCLPDDNALAKTVLNVSNDYWDVLRRQGFATDAQACPGMPERVILALANDPARILAGWLGDNLRTRLAQLGTSGGGRATIDAAIWPALVRLDRDDLRQALVQAGWPAPPTPAGAADAALRKTMPGRYYLKGRRELGPGILLRANGTFDYDLRAINDGETAQGRWTVRNGRLLLRRAPDRPAAYALEALTLTTEPNGIVTVRLGDDRSAMEGLRMTLLGDAPLMAASETGAYRWSARLPGPVRQIVLTSTLHKSLRPVVIMVPPEHALAGTFRLTSDPHWTPVLDFNDTIEASPGALTWQRNGGTMRFLKTAASAH